MKIIDLSMPLDNKTPAYPGDERIHIEDIARVEQDGYSKKNISCNTHCGTHIDAPIHMVVGGKNLDQFALDHFMGEVVLIDVRKKAITKDCLKDKKINSNSVVLFLTGQSDNCYKEYYQGTKYIPEDVAQDLVKLKIKAIGVDALSPDTDPYPIHKILLPKNILIIENLMNLKELIGKESTIHFFPLKITQGDGSPCRAIAFVK